MWELIQLSEGKGKELKILITILKKLIQNFVVPKMRRALIYIQY